MDWLRPLLLVTYHFPPSLAARGLQVAKLVKYVLAEGVGVDVVTVDSGDPSSSPGADMAEWFPSGTMLGVRRCRSRRPRWLDRASSLVWSFPAAGWSQQAAREALALVREKGPGHYRCLMTCAFPMDSHRIGRAVKRAVPELPWIAHFSDPWASNPLNPPRGFWQRPLRRRFERRVMAEADRLLFVSQPLLDYVMADWPAARGKAQVLPHTFDPELYPRSACPPGDRLTITYAGGLAGPRNIRPVVEVVTRLKQAGADLDRLRFRFIGGQVADAGVALNAVHSGLAECTGEVGYLDSLKLMCQADCLLLIDADLPASPFFPSKLADYFGSGRPVLGISPAHSCTTALLRELDLPVFDYGHLDDCALFLGSVLRGTTDLPAPAADRLARYSAPAVARQFLDIVRGVAR